MIGYEIKRCLRVWLLPLVLGMGVIVGSSVLYFYMDLNRLTTVMERLQINMVSALHWGDFGGFPLVSYRGAFLALFLLPVMTIMMYVSLANGFYLFKEEQRKGIHLYFYEQVYSRNKIFVAKVSLALMENAIVFGVFCIVFRVVLAWNGATIPETVRVTIEQFQWRGIGGVLLFTGLGILVASVQKGLELKASVLAGVFLFFLGTNMGTFLWGIHELFVRNNGHDVLFERLSVLWDKMAYANPIVWINPYGAPLPPMVVVVMEILGGILCILGGMYHFRKKNLSQS